MDKKIKHYYPTIIVVLALSNLLFIVFFVLQMMPEEKSQVNLNNDTIIEQNVNSVLTDEESKHPKQEIKEPKEDKVVQDANLTLLTDYVDSLEDLSYGIHCFSIHGPAKETLYVKDLSRPAIIFLTAYKASEWTVSAEDPEDILAIVLLGYEKQILKNTEYQAFIIEDKQLYIGLGPNENERIAYAESVERYLGNKPSTIWEGTYVIDGITSVVFKPIQTIVEGEVILVHPDNHVTSNIIEEAKYFNEEIDKYSSNVAGYTGVWGDSNFLANKGYTKGKYYFETEIIVGNDLYLADWTNLGIGTTSKYGGVDFYDEDGMNGAYGYGALYNSNASTNITKRINPIKSEKVKTGDIIGVATNLDEARVYYSLNGQWMNGDPESGRDGQLIKQDRTYYARAGISTTTDSVDGADKIIFYFQENDFTYHVPEGYRPYDF